MEENIANPLTTENESNALMQISVINGEEKNAWLSYHAIEAYIMTKLKSQTDVVFIKPKPALSFRKKLPDFYKLFPFQIHHRKKLIWLIQWNNNHWILYFADFSNKTSGETNSDESPKYFLVQNRSVNWIWNCHSEQYNSETRNTIQTTNWMKQQI